MARACLKTRRELAAQLGVHVSTVTKWERDGAPVAKRGKAGVPSRYHVNQVRAWLAKRDAKSPGTTNQSLAQERARKERAQAELAEQTYRVRARELVPAAEVLRCGHMLVTAVRTKLLAWETTLSDRLYRAATVEGIRGVERVIRDAVREVLTELSRHGTAITDLVVTGC